jgi:ribosomal protein L11 methylase PrmA
LSAEVLREILRQAVIDPAFRRGLFEQPERALAGYALTGDELANLRKIKLEDLYAQIGLMAVGQLLPMRVGQGLVIAPDWLNVPLAPEERLIRLDQQKTSAGINRAGQPVEWDGSAITTEAPQAFGSGLHPTTRLCLEALEEHLRGGECVVDLGTGSGILAIAAAKLGAAQVLALDTDAAAVQIAREHARLNEADQIVQVELGSVEWLRASTQAGMQLRADLIVANLVAPVILAVLQSGLVESLKPGGVMIVSGFRTEAQDEIVKAIEGVGLAISMQKQMAEWCIVISTRRA